MMVNFPHVLLLWYLGLKLYLSMTSAKLENVSEHIVVNIPNSPKSLKVEIVRTLQGK